MDEVAVWTRLLTPAEINFLYNDGVGVNILASFFGGSLKTLPSYEFSLEQGAQKTESVQLFNPGTVPRMATPEVLNPHSDLTVSLTEPNPASIASGETKTLPINLDASATPAGVYDDLLLKVTVDDGSTLYASIKVNVVPSGTGPLPDLAITANDIGSVTNTDGSVTLTATVRNRGTAPAPNVQVRFYEFDNPLSEPTIAQIAPNGIGSASITIPAMTAGDHLIRVVVDPADAIAELDETNNEASRLISIGSSGPTEGNILVTGSLPATVYTHSLFTLNGRAVYDLYVNGVRNTDYVVKGGSVQITVAGDGGAQWGYGDVYTDVEGNFAKTLQAPATPGTYRITMTVTDKIFIGTRELAFVVTTPGPTPPFQAPPAEWGAGYFAWDGAQWVWTWTNLLLTGPAPQFGSVPTAGCATSDALSGVQTNATPGVTGGDANGLGTFTASCTGATDNAGNAGATVSVTYQVTGSGGPINNGASTIGFWRNKNGQALITGGASSGGVCNSGAWLRQYAPYQDLSTTATCSQVATYVTNRINAATASGSAMNAMLKAQMLATSLSVYFSDPALGGNRIAAPTPIGGVSIDLTRICNMIDASSGTATCSGVYQDARGAFGGATSLTVSQMLAHAASQANAGGSLWYGNIKATQELAKNAFDAINNRVAFAP